MKKQMVELGILKSGFGEKYLSIIKKEKAFVSQVSHIISLTDAGKTEITTWPFYNTNNHDIVLQKHAIFNLCAKDFIIVTVPFSKYLNIFMSVMLVFLL